MSKNLLRAGGACSWCAPGGHRTQWVRYNGHPVSALIFDCRLAECHRPDEQLQFERIVCEVEGKAQLPPIKNRDYVACQFFFSKAVPAEELGKLAALLLQARPGVQSSSIGNDSSHQATVTA